MKAGVIGASGYTGAEILRILTGHPEIEVVMATANRYAGEPIGSLYPSLARAYPGSFEAFDPETACRKCDLFFLGLPHGESLKVLPLLAEPGKNIVDLSADFRLQDIGEYEKWYGIPHDQKQLLKEAVYGIPEINRKTISRARIVANPGCYSTAAIIGLYPLARAGLINGNVIVDAKSGVSGAGRKLSLNTHYPQVADGIEPYSVSGHRHLPEMIAELNDLASNSRIDLVFVPHLVPMNRGILCTAYVPLVDGTGELEVRALYDEAYTGEPFSKLLEKGRYPQTKAVQGCNNCDVSVELSSGGKTLIVMTAIDNLGKGAGGQAVQNMNIMCGLPETAGLEGPGLFP